MSCICVDSSVVFVLFLYTSAVIISVDCLTVLLKDIEEVQSLGHLLGVEEVYLEAIQTYYTEKECIISHIITTWLRKDPDDPVSQLSDALIDLGRHETAYTLVLLTSLGKSGNWVCTFYYDSIARLCNSGN